MVPSLTEAAVHEQNRAGLAPVLQRPPMIPAQVQISDRVFESFFARTNVTDEARMFRGLCESVGIGHDQLANPADRNRMVGFLMQSLQVDLAGSQLRHAGNGTYELDTPPASVPDENGRRVAQMQQIQRRVDQVPAAGAQPPEPAQIAHRAPGAVAASPSATPPSRTVLDNLARSPDPEVRANAKVMMEHRQAQQAGRLPTARDVPFSLPNLLRDITYSLKEGVLNVMRGGKFKDGFARAMATSSNPFLRESGVTMVGSRLQETMKRPGQPAAQPAQPTAAATTGAQTQARVASATQGPASGPIPQYMQPQYSPGPTQQQGAPHGPRAPGPGGP